ncbi:ComEC family competence protein [Veillonella rodentium]|uniref:ComEC family competence protein n=2 Tax=Veillonella rodentium TaxID=248315 RepID=A0A239Z4M1_9FIRM|nr:ComEC family competence protein [Veillonella rodentium]
MGKDCLRKFTTRLRFDNKKRHIPSSHMITHSIWAHLILCAMICGIISGYGQHYVILQNMYYIVAVCAGYMCITVVKTVWKGCSVRHFLLAIIIMVVSSFVAYWHISRVILDYNAYEPYYLHQEGEYLGIVTSAPEETVLHDTSYYKYDIEIKKVHPFKETAKDVYTMGKGGITVYTKVIDSEIKPCLGDIAVVTGEPKSLFMVEEEGRINWRGRYISNFQTGRMYDAMYRIASIQDIQTFRYAESVTVKVHRWCLHSCGIVRQSVDTQIGQQMTGTAKVLAQALFLGGHYNELGQETMKSFAYTGLIHILSISGSHIALLLALVYGIGRLLRLKKRTCLIVGVCMAILYCAIVGGSAPVVRATLMSLLLCIAYIKGRFYQAKQALCICAICCIIYDPLSVLDVSFQLSFGATYGLLLWGTTLYQRIQWLPSWLKAPVVLYLSAQLLILPLQLYYFHYISLVGIIAACIVAPLLDIAIMCIVCTVLISYIVTIPLLWYMIDFLLRSFLYINYLLSHSHIGLIWIGMMEPCCVYLYYVLLYVFTYLLEPETNRSGKLIFLCSVLMISTYILSFISMQYHKDTILHYIPMKQCNVLLCITPNHEKAFIYIDAPDNIKVTLNEYYIYNAVRAYGVKPRDVEAIYFHSNGKSAVLYQNHMAQIMVYNGQRAEKNLQLNDEIHTVFITSRSHVIDELFVQAPRSEILFGSAHGAMRDVDPSDEHIHILGYKFIGDVHL